MLAYKYTYHWPDILLASTDTPLTFSTTIHLFLPTHNPTDRSDSPTSLNMLTRGQLARETALANNPPQATPPDKPQPQHTSAGLGDLEKLPAEIRNKIYKLLLVEPGRFNLQTYQPHSELQYMIDGKPISRVAGQEVAPVDHKRNTKHRCQKIVKNGWVEVPSSTALVQLNKAVQAETSSILYGSNKFEFTTTKALDRFLIQIGENKKYLREVGLRWLPYGHDAVTGHRAMMALVAAKSLHTVSICGFPASRSERYTRIYMRTHVLMCLPVLKSLVQSFAQKNQSSDILEVLKVDQRIPKFRSHRYPDECNAWCAAACPTHAGYHCCWRRLGKWYEECKKDFTLYQLQGRLLELDMKFEVAAKLQLK
jgi:hypothetical protein